ncbi:MAG: tRNA (adenosine(37)-N6)-threonylcarbamoyltransferase complex dimerization subunit type 1 TsaB [Pontixanthobacter sp.]
MRSLVIETATRACSVALFENADGVWKEIAARHEVIGRGHAERLIPAIAALPDRGKAGKIYVSIGPGSFTGLRIGIAAARALGVAWGSEVRGFHTLALTAMSGAVTPGTPMTVCMNGGHGEWFVQNFGADKQAEGSVLSLSPDNAVEHARHTDIVGDRSVQLAELIGRNCTAYEVLPDARYFDRLGPVHVTGYVVPAYGRAPDASLPNSRADDLRNG